LAEAEIDLDPFTEDTNSNSSAAEGQSHGTGSSSVGEATMSNRPGMAEVLREETAKDGTRILTVSNPASLQQEPLPAIHSTQLVSLPSQLTRPASLPSLSPTQTGTAFVLSQETSKPIVKSTTGVGVLPHSISSSVKTSSQPNVLPIAVSVEPSPNVITFKLEDLTSQRLAAEQDNLDGNLDYHGGDLDDSLGSQTDSVASNLNEDFSSANVPGIESSENQGTDMNSLVRHSKRKRKHPSGMDEQSSPSNWTKSAASLLNKLIRFRGSAREKAEIDAAQWFNYPVDPADAPDYYTVIHNPMDFSTMKKKLEGGQYTSFEEFQADVELIRSNCLQYNREGTKVRRDCEEVMAFYRSELAKLQAEKQALLLNSTPPKKTKE